MNKILASLHTKGMEYDNVEYKGYCIGRTGHLWKITLDGRYVAHQSSQQRCFESIDKLLIDAYNERHPDNLV